MNAPIAAEQAPPRPSLRRHLLSALLFPLIALLVFNSIVTYIGALIYANHVHDRDLSNNALTLSQMLAQRSPDGTISPQANFLLEYDPQPQGRSYYSIANRHKVLAGNLPSQPDTTGLAVGDPPQLMYIDQPAHRLRAAVLLVNDPHHPTEQLIITSAETMSERHEQAREILLLSIPAQTVLILAVIALVRVGVGRGVRLLKPLTARLAAREHDLAPVDDADIPIEILPLTRTIDDLFGRLRHMLRVQDHFIADAAHQLRTPLAGMRVHVERAQQQTDVASMQEALEHIQRLTLRMSRNTSQLLALTRAQAYAPAPAALDRIDLAVFVPQLIAGRIHEALAAGADLGYDGPASGAWILGDAAALQELLDNLLDNALRYAGENSEITATLAVQEKVVVLGVEDNGPGVPSAMLDRLGERFFRVPGNASDGSGLGLAIVHRIADRHGAQVAHYNRDGGGFRVELVFDLSGQT